MGGLVDGPCDAKSLVDRAGWPVPLHMPDLPYGNGTFTYRDLQCLLGLRGMHSYD